MSREKCEADDAYILYGRVGMPPHLGFWQNRLPTYLRLDLPLDPHDNIRQN